MIVARRVLGIDPGTRVAGYACLERPATGRAAAPGGAGAVILEAGVWRLDASRGVPDRLVELEADMSQAIERLRPEAVAVEALYSRPKNVATAIVMAHARGVILLAARRAGLPVIELRATQVKKSLTGSGHAAKHQMQRAVQSAFALAEPPSPPDVADAIAVALCGLNRAA
ncbi:MAG: Holliday junction resolvase [Planctomyces sp.]|nr:Holliday junction resolvase [Planctomyces sp.]MBA4040028.1 Holliday junction resolvase [Planctomyces sp.]MBA4119136.1 Holliday junction resolvase [Isosphaera sp.]